MTTTSMSDAFVPGFDHDIFVSYAHVDNQSLLVPTGTTSGWVDTLVENLQRLFSQQLGRKEWGKLWFDPNLCGNGHDHCFGHSNLQIADRGMQNQLRLNKKSDDLQQQWKLLNEKLSVLNEQRILETRVDEKLRLRKSVDDTKTQCDQVEEQLKEMGS